MKDDGTWDFTPIAYSPDDLAFKELAGYDVDKLAGLFGVPAAMLAAPTTFAAMARLDVAEKFFDSLVAPMFGRLLDGLVDELDRIERTCEAGHEHATVEGRVFCDEMNSA